MWLCQASAHPTSDTCQSSEGSNTYQKVPSATANGEDPTWSFCLFAGTASFWGGDTAPELGADRAAGTGTMPGHAISVRRLSGPAKACRAYELDRGRYSSAKASHSVAQVISAHAMALTCGLTDAR